MSLASEAAKVMYYAFVLLNGEKLVALWMNGKAVKDDPGESATLKLESISVSSVIAVDVLNDLEQELITETKSGDLVIRDLLVRDYPIILRLIE